MKYCPLMSSTRQNSTQIPCMGTQCSFTDEAGDCLIRQALQCYVAKERTAAAQEDTYYRIYKDGTLDPITFKQHTNKTVDIDCWREREE